MVDGGKGVAKSALPFVFTFLMYTYVTTLISPFDEQYAYNQNQLDHVDPGTITTTDIDLRLSKYLLDSGYVIEVRVN